ncbi:NC2A protein, partial [Atractosteus spatula]|nr:NC2A protein [Atractosteus spatula]
MTQAHLRQCIETEKHFEFLKDLMSRAPPVPSPQEDNGANGVRAAQRLGNPDAFLFHSPPIPDMVKIDRQGEKKLKTLQTLRCDVDNLCLQ